MDEPFLQRLVESDGLDADERDLYNMLQQWRKHCPAPSDGAAAGSRRPAINPARQLAFHRLVLKLRLPLLPPTLLAAEVEQVVRQAHLNVTTIASGSGFGDHAEDEGGSGRLLRAAGISDGSSSSKGGLKAGGGLVAEGMDVNALFLDVYRWHCAGGAEQQGIKLPCTKRRRTGSGSGGD